VVVFVGDEQSQSEIAILGRNRAHRSFAKDVEARMESPLTFSYGVAGGILYVHSVPPDAERESDELGDGVIARMKPGTGAVEHPEILFFSSRFKNLGDELSVPLTSRMSAPLAG